MSFQFEKLRVLVVEDTVPMRKIIVAVLGAIGVSKITQAGNGEQAYQKFKNSPIDLIITDWLMEPMDGIELTKKIRMGDDSPNRFVPIVMITGYSAMKRVQDARDAGVTEFLVKPFTAHDIGKRIAYTINKPRDFIECPSYFGPDRRRVTVPNYSGPYRRGTDNQIGMKDNVK